MIHKELAKFDIISDNMVVEFLLKDIITKNIKGTNYTKLHTDKELEKVLQKVKKISPVKLDEEKSN